MLPPKMPPVANAWTSSWNLIVDKDACSLFELFDARWVGSTWAAAGGATWDLRSNALRPATWTSAGAIAHALRFTTNRTRTSYIYPARHQAGESSSTALPPMGTRVRLKASFETSGLSAHAGVIAEALKRYGMILADNGSPWYISGASDSRFDDDVMHELDVITGRDLEVVDTTGLVNGPSARTTLSARSPAAECHLPRACEAHVADIQA